MTDVLSPFKIRFMFPDGRALIREAKAGDVFMGKTLTHTSENIADSVTHGLRIEMKQPVLAGADDGSAHRRHLPFAA